MFKGSQHEMHIRKVTEWELFSITGKHCQILISISYSEKKLGSRNFKHGKLFLYQLPCATLSLFVTICIVFGINFAVPIVLFTFSSYSFTLQGSEHSMLHGVQKKLQVSCFVYIFSHFSTTSLVCTIDM